ncbi:MAG: ABC transporter ATP-binding protein [Phycisphaerales bacterium]|nr:ABC transporter ATP-binding protein [Phycisphaerales bacterium]
MGDTDVRALDDVSLRIEQGEFIAITGASGSGKSTMMHLLGCLDRPTAGLYALDGRDVSELSNAQLARVRNRKIGFVFQTFNLINRTTALENVAVPLFYSRQDNIREPARRALERVGLARRAHHRPNELSGGERQRVAIARAIVTNPLLLLADEPTGNLDSRTGEQIMQIFHSLNAQGVTIIIVTHEPEVAIQARRVVQMRDGRIVSDRSTEELRREQGGARGLPGSPVAAATAPGTIAAPAAVGIAASPGTVVATPVRPAAASEGPWAATGTAVGAAQTGLTAAPVAAAVRARAADGSAVAEPPRVSSGSGSHVHAAPVSARPALADADRSTLKMPLAAGAASAGGSVGSRLPDPLALEAEAPRARRMPGTRAACVWGLTAAAALFVRYGIEAQPDRGAVARGMMAVALLSAIVCGIVAIRMARGARLRMAAEAGPWIGGRSAGWGRFLGWVVVLIPLLDFALRAAYQMGVRAGRG